MAGGARCATMIFCCVRSCSLCFTDVCPQRISTLFQLAVLQSHVEAFDSNDAAVVCRELGLSGGTAIGSYGGGHPAWTYSPHNLYIAG